MDLAKNTLVSFLAPSLRQVLGQKNCASRSDACHRGDAAMLFADVSGWSALVTEMSAKGKQGVDEISRQLNLFFGAMIDTIDAYGGSVEKFAGDAVMAQWPVVESETLARAVERATQCGMELVARLSTVDSALTAHAGVGCGSLLTVRSLLTQNRGLYLLTGEPLVQMSEAAEAASAQQVCVSHAAASTRREGRTHSSRCLLRRCEYRDRCYFRTRSRP
jgi:class 3 adenylate cyclase